MKIRAGVPLPKNFNQTMLDKKFVDRLEDLGIDYEQSQIRQRRTSILLFVKLLDDISLGRIFLKLNVPE